jgi:hypothetical protein
MERFSPSISDGLFDVPRRFVERLLCGVEKTPTSGVGMIGSAIPATTETATTIKTT